MTISRDDVIWGYRLILGREPESEAAIQAHINVSTIYELREALLTSSEFQENIQQTTTAKRAERHFWDDSDRTKVLFVGNCQAPRSAKIADQICLDIQANSIELARNATYRRLEDYLPELLRAIAEADIVYAQEYALELLTANGASIPTKIRVAEPIVFEAYHPDIVYVQAEQTRHYVVGPLGQYQSAIALWGFKNRKSLSETLKLFDPGVFGDLGYLDFRSRSMQRVAELDRLMGIDLSTWIARDKSFAPLMHSMNHPTRAFLTEYTAQLLERDGFATDRKASDFQFDDLLDGSVWPVYPPIAETFGFQGHYRFKTPTDTSSSAKPFRLLELANFIEESFEAFALAGPGLICDRIDHPPFDALNARFETLARPIERDPSPSSSNNVPDDAPSANGPSANGPSAEPGARQRRTPYASLPDSQYWSRSIARIPPERVDLMTVDPRMIGPATRVASAGSCFAQHIARSLREAGLCYHVTETGDHYAVAEATARQYGTFSARYGNLYTPKQLIQLMDRAYGKFVPVEPWWDIPGKGWADPFRPTVEPLGFASIKDAEDDRTRHLAAVRSLFETLDVFIYTLGLTEAWRSKQDGAVFPVVPGAVAGTFDDAKYEFVNYTTLELVQDLDAFQLRLAAVNPGAAVIYTVSPVPLVASYARDHVAVASSASKSALRAAAQEITSRVPRSYYFPSYEIITGPWTRGRYFAEDARSVTDEGVAHVMQTFRRHFVGSDASADRLGRLQPIADIVCDEELLDDLPDPAIEPLVIHLHVQKTGGSTLNAVLAEAYEEGRSRSVTPSSIGSEFASNSSGVDLLYGHLNVDDIEAIGRPTRLVAFVREPEPRLASAYDYFRVLDPLGPEGHALVKRAHAAETLEDFLDDSVVAISPEIWNHQTWALMGDRLWRQWRADVTMLPTDDISAYVDAQVAPVMRARLARFFYVGNFARLEHGIHELCVRLGRPAPTAIPHRNSLSDASDRNRLSTARTSHDTRTAHARNETPLTQHAHFWALDAALYRIALERFG